MKVLSLLFRHRIFIRQLFIRLSNSGPVLAGPVINPTAVFGGLSRADEDPRMRYRPTAAETRPHGN